MALVAVGEVLDILGVMEETEKAIADLYGRFGRTWPDEETLWLNMAGEEVGHVEIIGRLKALIAAAPDNFQLNRPFNVTALRTFLEGIERQKERLEKGLLTPERALTVARDLEASLIEKAYHEIVKTKDLTYLNLVRQIVAETYRHRSAIEQKIREVGIRPEPPGQ